MQQSLQIFLQNTQGTLILDTLNEFRKDAIRCIFRDMLVPPDSANTNDVLRAHSANLRSFLCDGNAESWTTAFESWFGAKCPERVKTLYAAVIREAGAFASKYEGKKKAEVWAYLYSPEFSEHLRISNGDKGEAGPESLSGMFNIVAIAIDDGMIRLIQPHDIVLDDDFHTLQCCFPILPREQLEALAKDFEQKDFVAHQLLHDFSTGPAIFRGTTVVCYDTGYYVSEEISRDLLPKAKRVYNIGFLQIRPNAQKQNAQADGSGLVGFFQLQCCIPGLMDVLVPRSLGIGRDIVVREGERVTAARGSASNIANAVLVEFADSWWETDSAARSLCTFWRLRELTHGWPRRLRNMLDLSKRQTRLLEREISRREQQRYRQQLEQLDRSLDELMLAAGRIDHSTGRIRAIVRDPSEGVFGIHHKASRLFDENVAAWRVASDVQMRIEHNPSAYNVANPDDVMTLRAIHAVLLSLWTGFEYTKYTSSPFADLIAALQVHVKQCETPNGGHAWLLGAVRPILLRSPSGQSPSPSESLTILLGVEFPAETLKLSATAAKCLLFTPFKYAASTLAALPIAVAAGLEMTATFTFEDDAIWRGSICDKELNGESMRLILDHARSPALPKHVLQFLIGVTQEAKNRETAALLTQLEIVQKKARQEVKMTFGEKYADGSLDGLRQSANALLEARRDWRIDVGPSGNFTSPYCMLANSLLGVQKEWQVVPVANLKDGEVMCLQNPTAKWRFSVIADSSSAALRWEKAL